MDSRSLSIVSVFIEDEDDRSFLGVRDSSKGPNLLVCDPMIVNALNISISVRQAIGNKSNIFTSYPSIGSTVYKRVLGSR